MEPKELSDMEPKELSDMEPKELSIWSNDETIVIKPPDKRGAEVILSKSHYQSMIM